MSDIVERLRKRGRYLSDGAGDSKGNFRAQTFEVDPLCAEAATEIERLRSMFSAGVSVDAPHATSVDGDASHTSTAPAEPPQPTRPDPGITERKPRR